MAKNLELKNRELKRRQAGVPPGPGFKGRWSFRDKTFIAERVVNGELEADRVMRDYPDLSREELESWVEAYVTSGGDRYSLRVDDLARPGRY